MTATLNVSGLPYTELGGRSMLGLVGWKPGGGRLVLVRGVCMVGLENIEDGGGESWRVLDMGSLLSVEDGNHVL